MKRIICALLIVLLIASLCACSNNEQTSNDNQVYDTENEASNDEIDYDEETEDENQELDIESTDTYKLSEGSSAFNNKGIAWARISEESTDEKTVALINTKGEIIYLLDKSKLNDADDIIGTTPFVNGLSAIYEYDSSASGDSYPGFLIVNEQGEEVYSSSDENLYMCGQAEDGTFILAKHDSGFDRDLWYAYLLDTDLKLTKTKIELDEEVIGQDGETIQALSDGIYYLPSSDSLLNVPLKKCISLYTGEQYIKIYGHDEKYAYLSYEYFCHFPINQLKKAKSTKEIEKSISSVAISGYYDSTDNDSGVATYILKKWNKGSIYYSDRGKRRYIDIKGKDIFKFPTFSNDASIDDVDDFSGKYAAIYMTGADGNQYVSIVDGKGKMQYDPVQVSNDTHCSYDGYVFFYSDSDGTYSVITPDGSKKKIGDNLSGLKDGPIANSVSGSDSQHAVSNIYYGIEIGGGYIFCSEKGYKYVSTDGKTTIDEVAANYNSDGNLVYTDKDGKTVVNLGNSKQEDSSDEESSDDNIIDATTAKKEYINIDNFSIIGKWKNVGDYTYGQAQKGAIITFNGTNCNFFSPKDTYAFYKDGDDYTLDCTSPLADTVSFTVKIVDEDNIDVVNGSNIVELKRVS